MTPQDWMTFIVTTAVILIAPGPTNALIAAACARAGFRTLPLLVLAELTAYLLSIAVLLTLAGPAVATSPVWGPALKLVSALLLVVIALRLARLKPQKETEEPAEIGPVSVFLTTLINPKGMIFAFAVFPPPEMVLAHPGLITAFVVLTAFAGFAWGCSGRLLALVAGERIVARITVPVLLALAAWVAFSAGRSLFGT